MYNINQDMSNIIKIVICMYKKKIFLIFNFYLFIYEIKLSIF